jgi:hypothetical protein
MARSTQKMVLILAIIILGVFALTTLAATSEKSGNIIGWCIVSYIVSFFAIMWFWMYRDFLKLAALMKKIYSDTRISKHPQKIVFQYGGRTFELFWDSGIGIGEFFEGLATPLNDMFIFCARTKTGDTFVGRGADKLWNSWVGITDVLPEPLFGNLTVYTNNQIKVRRFLADSAVRDILSHYRSPTQKSWEKLVISARGGRLYLLFGELGETLLRAEFGNWQENPDSLKLHLDRLTVLAEKLDSIPMVK